jgi:hypothetical protein
MSIINAIFRFFMSIVVTMTGLFAIPGIPPATARVEDIFDSKPIASTVYAVRRGSLSNDETAMLASLQGIVAQQEAAIVLLDDGGLRLEYITAYASEHSEINFVLLQKPGNTSNPLSSLPAGQVTTQAVQDIWGIVDIFRDRIKNNGFVTFLRDDESIDINIAANYAGIENWLSVPTTLRDAAIQNGYVEKENVSLWKGSNAKRQEKIFDLYKNQYNNKFVMHERGDWITDRDLGISQKAFSFFTQDVYSTGAMVWSGGMSFHIEGVPDLIAERAFRHKVLSWAVPDAAVIGFWDDTDVDTDEIMFIQDIALHGNYIVPFHGDSNLTFMAAMDKVPVKQRTNTIAPAAPVAKNGKHYVAFYVTDGDNVSWLYGSGSLGNFYKDRIASSDTFKLSVTRGPMMSVLMPFAEEMLYRKNEVANGGNNYLFAGTSGLGVTYPVNMSLKRLTNYADLTAQSMKLADMSVIGPMESVTLNPTWKVGIQVPVEAFSKQDQIKGGIYQIDGERYIGGDGEVFWSTNGKPFISAKYSLWTDTTANDYAALANKLNNASTDITRYDTYTVVAIQPWGIDYNVFSDFVQTQLADHVELVNVEELIALVAKNVKH